MSVTRYTREKNCIRCKPLILSSLSGHFFITYVLKVCIPFRFTLVRPEMLNYYFNVLMYLYL